MTDRWRSNIEDEGARRHLQEDRRQNKPSAAGPGGSDQPLGSHPTQTKREDWSHGPDGGLDSGRGFGRIGVPRSDPWADERRSTETGRRPLSYNRQEDYTGRGPRNYRRPD